MATRSVKVALTLDGESQWKKEMKGVNGELKTLKVELGATEAKFLGQANSMAALTAKQAGLKQVYAQQKQKVADLTDALARANEEFKDQPDRIYYYRQSLAYAETELAKLDAELKQNQTYLDEAAASADGCATSIDGYGKTVKGSTTDSSGFVGKLKDLAREIPGVGAAIDGNLKSLDTFKDFLTAGLTAGAVKAGLSDIASAVKALGGAFTESVKTAAEYETALAKVQTIADSSAVSSEKMADDILELSNATGISAAALADTTYQAISASVATEEAVSAAGIATKLAAAGFTDATTAIDALTTVVNSYGDAAGGMVNVSDHLLAVQNLGKTSVDELASSIGKVIPIASAYNVSLDDLSTGYTLLTKNGVATAESTTYLKAMFNELGDSGSSIGKLLTEQTGKSFAQLQQEGTSLYDVLSVLMDTVDGQADAFNNLWSSSEAGIGALTLVSAGAEEYATTLEAMRNSTGLTETSYATMTDTMEFKTQRLQNVWENLKIQLGNDFLPAVSDVMDGLTEVMSGNVDEGLLLIEQGLDNFGQELERLGPLAGEALGKFATVLVDNLPMLFDVAGDFIGALIDGIASSMPELIPAAIDLVLTVVSALLENIDLLIDAAIKLVVGMAVGLVRAIPELLLAIPKIIIAIVNGLIGAVSELRNVGVELIKGLWNGIKSMGSWIGEKVKGFSSVIVDGFKTFFGIHSPASKHMPFLGKMTAQGLGVGWSKEAAHVTDQMAEELSRDLNSSLSGLSNDLSLDYQLSTALSGDKGISSSAFSNDYTTLLTRIDHRLAQWADSFVVVLDDGTIVGKLAPKINAELGQLAKREERRA